MKMVLTWLLPLFFAVTSAAAETLTLFALTG